MDAFIKSALKQVAAKKVLVIGDVMLDQYTYGDIVRISPEAPVPVIRKRSESFNLGGAANVASNIASLGAHALLIGTVGNDGRKDVVQKLLVEHGIDGSSLLVDDSRPTTLKNRIVAGHHQQILRFDDEDARPLDRALEDSILAEAAKHISEIDIIIFSDYSKGIFTPRTAGGLLKLAKGQGKKVIADLKPQNKALFVGVNLVTPNMKEAVEITGKHDWREALRALVGYFKSDVYVTRGDEGISIRTLNGNESHVPSHKVRVADISGAGDTVVAATSLALATGMDLYQAVMVANAAGGVVVQKPGTATVTLEELESQLREGSHFDEAYTVEKAWGHETWIENNDKYCSKLLVLKKGYECGLHYHKIKDKTFLIKSGHVRLVYGDEVLHMRDGNFIRIPPGTVHSFKGMEDSVILEISNHHDEADSYHLTSSQKVPKEKMSQPQTSSRIGP